MGACAGERLTHDKVMLTPSLTASVSPDDHRCERRAPGVYMYRSRAYSAGSRSAKGRTPGDLVAVIVQQGKILDYIDGITQRNETPEEYVRQEIAKSLVREYGYQKQDMSVEFTLRLGTRRPRADIVIFNDRDQHEQDRARLIIECKSHKTKSEDSRSGVGQLKSYMAACPNVTYGMWTNGVERVCYRRVDAEGEIDFQELPDIPSKDELTMRPSVRGSINSRLLRQMPSCSRSDAVTTTSPEIRDCRNQRRLGAPEDHFLQNT